MMNSEERQTLLRQRLTTALAPTSLEIIDEGHLHVGHPGAQDGAGHFRIRIKSLSFKDKTTLACHRLVYDAVGDLMDKELHALRIEVVTTF